MKNTNNTTNAAYSLLGKMFFMVFLLLMAGMVNAQTTYTWQGGAAGNFNTTGNWSPNGLPGASDSIIINGSSPTIFLANNTTVKGIYLNGTSVIFGGALTTNQSGCSITSGSKTVTYSPANASIANTNTAIVRTITTLTPSLAAGTTVSSGGGTTSLTLSVNATGTGTATLNFYSAFFSLTATNVTVNNGTLSVYQNFIINTALTMSNSGIINLVTQSNGNGLTLGNGNAFTLTGNSATNYFDGNSNSYWTYNTTTPLTVFYNPTTTPSVGAINISKGNITLGNNFKSGRVGLNSLNSQVLTIASGVNFTITGGTSNPTSNPNGGYIDASAPGAKVTIGNNNGTVCATTGRLFGGSKINNLEIAVSSGNVFTSNYALTVDTLTLTSGTYNNSVNNVTVNKVVTRSAATALLAAPPIYSVSGTSVNIGATCSMGNEVLPTSGSVKKLTINATFKYTLDSTCVIGYNMTNAGVGYTVVPTLAFSSGTATCGALILGGNNSSIRGIGISNQGGNYTSTPTISFSGGTQATPSAWVASTAYGNSYSSSAGSLVANASNYYVCATTGTSAASGGPTGTSTAIVDGVGALKWDYLANALTPSATATLAPLTLSIDSIDIYGTLYFGVNNSAFTLTVNKGLIIESTGTFSTLNSTIAHTININGNIVGLSGSVLDLTLSTASPINFSGTVPQSVSGTFSTLKFQNLNVNGTSNSLTFSVAPTISGTTTINVGDTLQTGVTYPGAVTANGTFQINQGGYASGSFTWGGASTLVYNNSSGTYGPITGHPYWTTGSSNQPYNVSFLGAGTVDMGSTAHTIAGTVLLNEAVTNSSGLTINGTLQINGGNLGNAPTYGASSTLLYNTTYGTFNEWTGGGTSSVAAGSGVPANVTVNSGTVTLSGARGIPGNLVVRSGAGFVLNTTSGNDFYIGGNLTDSGSTWTNNSRAVNFVGSGTQTISATINSGTQSFDYLILNNTGTVQLATSPATNISIATTSGNVLQLINSGTLDLNGKTITLTGNGGNVYTNAARSITSTLAGGVFAIASSAVKYVSNNGGVGTLSFASNVNVNLNGGLDFGSSGGNISTVNGTLNILAGGYVNTNPPNYASTSTLAYNSGGAYGAASEWTTGSGSGAGVPNNVIIGSTVANSTVNFGSGSSYRQANGNVTISNATAGSALTLSSVAGGDLYLKGNITNNGTFTSNGRLVNLIGTANNAPQVIAGTWNNSSNSTNTFGYLTINNTGTTSGVSLSNPINITGTLTLTNGLLNSNSNAITVINNSASAVAGGSTTSYIVGSLAWTFNASTGTFNFPVGTASAYGAFAYVTPNTGGSAKTATVTYFNTGSSGTVDGTLSAVSGNYWTVTTNSALSSVASIKLTNSSVTSSNVVAFTNNGNNYTTEGGTVSGSSVTSTATLPTPTTADYYALGTLPVFSLGSVVPTAIAGISGQSSGSGYYGQQITVNGFGFTGGATTLTIGGTTITPSVTTNTTLVFNLPTTISSGTLQISQGATDLTSSFTVLGYITSGAGDWNTAATWLNSAAPTSNGQTVTVNSAVTVNGTASYTSSSITLNSGSLTFGASGSLGVTNLTIGSGTTLSMASGGTLTIANSGNITNSGTFTYGTGTVAFSGTGTFSGITNFYSVSLSGGVNLSGTIINGTLTINSGGFVSSTAPAYASGSTLKYNTTGTYGRSVEWTAASGTLGTTAGYPYSVQISNSTTLNVPNGSSLPTLAIGGNLTVDAGSSFYMDYGSPTSNNALTVGGNVVISGNLSLGNQSGGDINVGGDWTRTGVFTPNGRAVFFNGAGNSAINSATTFDYLLVNKSSGSATVTLGAACTVSQNLSLTQGILDYSSYTLTVAGNVAVTSGTITPASSGTLAMTGNSKTIGALALGNFSVSGSSNSVTATGALTIATGKTLTINSGNTLNMSAFNLSAASGTFTPIVNGTLTTASTSSTPIPAYDWTNGNTATGTISFGSTGTIPAASTFYNLTTTNTGTVYGNGTITIYGNFSPVASSSATQGTIVFASTTATQSVSAFTFNSLTVSNTTASGVQATGALVVNSTLNIGSSALLDLQSNALSGTLSSISGTGTLKTANTTTTPFPASKTWTCLVRLSNTAGGQTIPSGGTVSTFNGGLTCDNTSGVDSVIGGGIAIGGKLTMASTTGIFAIGAFNLTSGSTTFDATSFSGTFRTSAGGSVTNQFPSGTYWADNSTVVYTAAASSNTRLTPANYYNLNTDNGYSQFLNFDYVTNSSATFTVRGNLTTANSSTTSRFTSWVFSGTGQTIPAWSFYNLTLGTNSIMPSGNVNVFGTFNPSSTSSASQGTISFNLVPAFADLNVTIPGFTYNNLSFGGSVSSILNKTGSTVNGSVAVAMNNSADATNLTTNSGIAGTNIPANTTIAGSNGTVTTSYLTSPFYILYNSVYYLSYPNATSSNTDWSNTAANQTLLTGTGGTTTNSGVYVKSHFGSQTGSATFYAQFTNSSSTVTFTKNSSTSGLNPGMIVTTTNANVSIPAGTYIQTIGTATSIGGGNYTFAVTLSAAPTVTSGPITDQNVLVGSVNIISGALSGFTSGNQYNNTSNPNFTYSPSIILSTAATGTSGSATISTYNINLTFASGITVNGLFSDTHSGSYTSVTNNGAVTIANGGTVSIASTTFEGNLSIPNSATVAATGTLNLNKTLTIGSAATLNMSTFALVANSNGGASFSTSINSNGTLQTQSTSSTALPKGYTWGGTVNYSSASGQTVVGGTYNNLNLTGGSRTLSANNSTSDSIIIQGNYTAGSSTTISTSFVVFNGSGAQTISSAATNTANFYNLSVRKSGTANALTLNTPVRVGTANKGALRLQNARIVTTNANPLIICDSVISTPGQSDSVIVSGTAYVDGPIKRYVKTGSSGYLFPVGNYVSSANYYMPDTITAVGTTDTISITAIKSAVALTPDGVSVSSMDNSQYWVVRPNLNNTLGISFTPLSIGTSNTVAALRSGVYASVGGTAYSSSINTTGLSVTAGNDSTYAVGVVNIPQPSITSISSDIPGGTSMYPGSQLTITGTNLLNEIFTTTVLIGNQSATIVSNDGSTLVVTVPAGGTTNVVSVNTGATPATRTGTYYSNAYISAVDGAWATAATWSPQTTYPGQSANSAIVVVRNQITMNSNISTNPLGSLTINSGDSISMGTTTSGTQMVVSGTFINDGILKVGSPTGNFFTYFTANGTSTNNGTIRVHRGSTTNNLIIGGAFTNNGTVIDSSLFQINSGGLVSGNGISYGNSASLLYNSGSTYSPGSEWISGLATGAGVPINVQIGNAQGSTPVAGSSVNFGDGRVASGTLLVRTGYSATIANGNTLTINVLQDSGTVNIGTTTLGSTAIYGTNATLVVKSGTSNIGTQGMVNLYGYMKMSGNTNILQNTNNGNVGKLNVFDYAVYEAAYANPSIPSVTRGSDATARTWPSNATLYYSGLMGSPGSGDTTQTFGNVLINTTIQTNSITFMGFTSVNNMVILNTGPVNSGYVIRYQNNATKNWNSLQVGGSYTFNGSTISTNHCIVGFAYNSPITTTAVAGNVIIGSGDTLISYSTATLQIGGNLTVNGVFTNTNTTVAFTGTTASTISTSNASVDFNSLTINKTGTAANAKVTLGNPATVSASGILTLTEGRIVTTNNALTVLNTSASAVTGGGNSPSAYIDGPLVWTLPANNVSGTYIYPIGTYSGATDYYYPLTLNSPVTGSGTVTVTAHAIKAAAGGTGDGSSLQSSLSGRQYWTLTSSGNYTGSSISLGATASDIAGSGYTYNAIGFSTTQSGTYASYAGTPTSSAVNSSSTVSGNGYLALGTVYVSPSPTITTVSANIPSGQNAGYSGTTLTINGTNLSTVSAVTIGGVAASSFTVISNTQITAVVASSGVSSGSITVTNSNPISPTATKIGFVYYSGIASKQSGAWSSTSTWLAGVVPTGSSTVIILHDVTVDNMTATVATLTINSGASLSLSSTANNGLLGVTSAFTNNGTFNYAAAGTFSSNNSTITGTFTNSGTVNIGSSSGNKYGIVTFNGTVSNTGTITVNNSSTSTALILGSTLINSGTVTINNALQLNAGGAITGTGVVYGSASTLYYNTGTITNPGSEWLKNPSSTTVGTLGVPQHVTIGDKSNGTAVTNTVVSFGTDNYFRALAGNLTISTTSTGAGLQLSSVAGGDLKIGGNFTASKADASAYNSFPGGFDANGRMVHFIASSGSQTITGPAASAIAFHYITIGASTSSTNYIALGSDIAITAPNGGAPFTLTAPITGNGIFYLNANSGTTRNITIGTIGQTISGTVYIRGGGASPSNLTINGNTSSSLNLNIDYGGGNSFLTNFTVNNVNVNLQSAFTVKGSLVNNGTISGSSTLTLGGASAQTIDGTGTINNLTINNAAGVTINSGMQNITGVLKVTTGNLNTGNNLLTLKSTSIANSGILGQVSGSLSGTATVERYIPKGFRAYRDLSASGVYSATNYLFNTWQESGSYANTGYGMFITGIKDTIVRYNSVDATYGIDHSLTGNASAFYYRAGWDTVKNTKTELLNPYQSYRVLVRGDRSFDLDTTGVVMVTGPTQLAMNAATTLRATGSLITGTVTYTTSGVSNGVYTNNIGLNNASNGYTYVANPYAAPIDFHNIYTSGRLTNIDPRYYYLDPTMGSTGSYVSYNAVSGVSSNNATYGQFIQAGQGFLIGNTSSSPQLQITEADKSILSTSRTSVFGAASPNSKMAFSLIKQGGGATAKMDGAVAVFGTQFSNAIGIEDNVKMSNAADNLSILEGTKSLSIDGRLPATANDVLGINIGSLSGTTYQLEIDATAYTSSGLSAYLKDAYKNTTIALAAGINTISFTADTKVAATYQNRFSVIFKPTTLSVNSIVATATANGSVATITWNTVGEKGVAKFEVEKSTDGASFTQIAEQVAKNTATAVYAATDNAATAATNYYRIKAISTDGTIAYSNIAKVIENLQLTTYNLFPNPLTGKTLNVQLGNVVAGKYVVSIYNSLGQKVTEQSINHAGGNGTHAVNIESSMAKGVYNVVIRDINSKEQVFQSTLSVQ